MLVTMIIAALVIDGIWSLAGLIPDTRPTRDDVFGSIDVDYKLFLNVVGLVVFGALMWLTVRRGATDPVCGMKVDKAKALKLERDGQTYYFCSEHCRHKFEAGETGDEHAGHEHAHAHH
jgi:YHS domain-containing protein